MRMLSDQTADMQSYLRIGICASALLHIGLALCIDGAPRVVSPRPVFVKIISVPSLQRTENQIVTPPDSINNVPPAESRLLSERDSSALQEQIRRGDGPDAGRRLGDGGSSSANSVNRSTVRQAPPARGERVADRVLDLSADPDLLEKLGAPPSGTTQPNNLKALTLPPPAPEPFSRPIGAEARFFGMRGSIDFLPDLRDGDITLLNAKADKFAVFVRRVATQVFNSLRVEGWKDVPASGIREIENDAVILATLSPQGQFISAELVVSSGSLVFDRLLQRSVTESAYDPHPPAEASGPDGNFHFIFSARSWVRLVGDPRSSQLSEQRWLLLRTGLD